MRISWMFRLNFLRKDGTIVLFPNVLKCWWATWLLDHHQTSMEILADISWSCQKGYKDIPSYLISPAVQNKSIYFRKTKQAVCIQNQFKSRVDESQEMYRSMHNTLLQTGSTSSRGNEKTITWITQLETYRYHGLHWRRRLHAFVCFLSHRV